MTQKTITVQENILDDNTKKSQVLHAYWKENNTFVINIMASPGAGKTSFLEAVIPLFLEHYSCAVIEGDVIDLDVDRLRKVGIPVVRANTGGACHLDAVMVERIQKDLPRTDIVFIENVGNLICPSHFAIGQDVDVVIASVPEGDDKPVKYPHMFETVDAVVLNKTDLIDACEFHVEQFKSYLKKVNPDVPLFTLSAKNHTGLSTFVEWIRLVSRKQ